MIEARCKDCGRPTGVSHDACCQNGGGPRIDHMSPSCELDCRRAQVASLKSANAVLEKERAACVCNTAQSERGAVWNMVANDLHAKELDKIAGEFADYRNESIRHIRNVEAERDDAIARWTAAEVQLAGGSGTGCDRPDDDSDAGVCDRRGVTWVVGKGYRCKRCEEAG